MSKQNTNAPTAPEVAAPHDPAAPALAWIDEHVPPPKGRTAPQTKAEGYGRLLDLLATPPPAFLATEAGALDFNTARWAHLAPEEADRLAGALVALRALLATPAGPAFLDGAGEGWVPEVEGGRAYALGFYRTPAEPERHVRDRMRDGRVPHVCEVTGRTFWARPGDLVPCVWFAYPDERGDAEWWPVHPDLAAASPAGFARARWGAVAREVHQAAVHLVNVAHELGTATLYRTPDAVPSAPAEWAWRRPTAEEVRALVSGPEAE